MSTCEKISTSICIHVLTANRHVSYKTRGWYIGYESHPISTLSQFKQVEIAIAETEVQVLKHDNHKIGLPVRYCIAPYQQWAHKYRRGENAITLAARERCPPQHKLILTQPITVAEARAINKCEEELFAAAPLQFGGSFSLAWPSRANQSTAEARSRFVFSSWYRPIVARLKG